MILCYKREKKEHKDRKRQKRKIRNRTLNMPSARKEKKKTGAVAWRS